MEALGAELIEHGGDFQAALEYAMHLAETRHLHFVPSFHPLLVHGTSTYALEFLTAVPELDTIYVPIGMGSSLCGMIAVRNALGLKTKIIGVVPTNAPAFALSFRERKVVPALANSPLADGLSCRLPDSDALETALANVDHIVEVSEEEIAAAMRAYYQDTHNVAEGAAAAGLAAVLREVASLRGLRVGVVLTGGNVDRERFIAALSTT
jgi:threonine dehydratase